MLPNTTAIKALVSMINGTVKLTNHRIGGSPTVVAQAFAVKSVDNWGVPWCRSLRDFNNGEHLTLEFSFNGSPYEYSIWQEHRSSDSDYIRFTEATRNPSTGEIILRPSYNDAARKLASNTRGDPYHVPGPSESVLVVSLVGNVPWVIIYRVGGNF